MDRLCRRRLWPWGSVWGADGDVQNRGARPFADYRKTANVIYEYPSLNPPLGMFAKQTFSESTIDCEAGDTLLILTDGLTEVFDKSGAELGLEPLKSAFIKNANLPLGTTFCRTAVRRNRFWRAKR